MSFPNRICVTGSNRGIGLEFVRQLALGTSSDSTRKILACCRLPDSARDLKTLAEKHKSITILPLDVENDESISNMAAEVSKRFGSDGIDLLINNAGYNGKFDTDITKLARPALLQVFDINVASQLMIIKSLMANLKQGGGNSLVVNISSKMGSISDASTGSYGYRMSKTCVNMFTKILSNELRDTGIMVIALHPGWVKTDMGGPNALITTEDSVNAMLKTITNLPDSSDGAFLNYDGTVIPY